MKKLIPFLLFLTLGPTHGAVINVGNLIRGQGDTIVTDYRGRPIGELHSFLSIDPALAGVTRLDELRALGGDGLSLLPGENTFPGVEGMFTNSYDGPGGNGEPIYLILATDANLGRATLLGLIDTGLTLDPDGPMPDINNYALVQGNGTPIVGRFRPWRVTADWTSIVGAENTGPVFTLRIPEPSIGILMPLAGLGWGMRRRRFA